MEVATGMGLISLALSVGAMVKAYGRKEGAMAITVETHTGLIQSASATLNTQGRLFEEFRLANEKSIAVINETLDRHKGYHYDHYEHSRDEDAHWTSREREIQARMLEELRSDMKEVLKRTSGGNGR